MYQPLMIPKPDSFTVLAPHEIPESATIIEGENLAAIWCDSLYQQTIHNLLEERYGVTIQAAPIGS